MRQEIFIYISIFENIFQRSTLCRSSLTRHDLSFGVLISVFFFEPVRDKSFVDRYPGLLFFYNY